MGWWGSTLSPDWPNDMASHARALTLNQPVVGHAKWGGMTLSGSRWTKMVGPKCRQVGRGWVGRLADSAVRLLGHTLSRV